MDRKTRAGRCEDPRTFEDEESLYSVFSPETPVDMPGIEKRLVIGLGLVAGLASSPVCADDCIRSTPAPVFSTSRSDIRAHSFTIKSDHEAVERFRIGADTWVQVEHGGCEYFVTRLRFESPKLFAKTYSDASAYENAASLLRNLKQFRPELNFDLELASATLRTESGRKRTPRLNKEFPIQGDGVPPLEAVVQIDAAGRGSSFGYLEITFFRGPL